MKFVGCKYRCHVVQKVVWAVSRPNARFSDLVCFYLHDGKIIEKGA